MIREQQAFPRNGQDSQAGANEIVVVWGHTQSIPWAGSGHVQGEQLLFCSARWGGSGEEGKSA